MSDKNINDLIQSATYHATPDRKSIVCALVNQQGIAFIGVGQAPVFSVGDLTELESQARQEAEAALLRFENRVRPEGDTPVIEKAEGALHHGKPRTI